MYILNCLSVVPRLQLVEIKLLSRHVQKQKENRSWNPQHLNFPSLCRVGYPPHLQTLVMPP